jgi:hypothetical protein
LFANIICDQNDFLNSVKILPVYGIHSDVMGSTTFREQILNLSSKGKDDNESNEKMFIGTEETDRTDSAGKWLFLCTANNEDAAKEWIDNQLPKIYEEDEQYTTVKDAFRNEFPQPRRSGRMKQHQHLANYASVLQATTPTPKDQNHNGRSKQHRQQTRKPKTKATIVFPWNTNEFPPISSNKPKLSSDSGTYSTRTAATIGSQNHHPTSHASSKQGTIEDMPGPKVSLLLAKISALEKQTKKQDAIIAEITRKASRTEEILSLVLSKLDAIDSLSLRLDSFLQRVDPPNSTATHAEEEPWIKSTSKRIQDASPTLEKHSSKRQSNERPEPTQLSNRFDNYQQMDDDEEEEEVEDEQMANGTSHGDNTMKGSKSGAKSAQPGSQKP